jgi:hypothetical protein
MTETIPATDEWDAVAFVCQSSYRESIVRQLAASRRSTIAVDTDLRLTPVLRTLGRLRPRSLVDLLVADDRRKGRIYGLTDRGRTVRVSIDDR